VWIAVRGWTGWHQQHGGCCGRPHWRDSGPPGSSRRWQTYPQGSERSSEGLAPAAGTVHRGYYYSPAQTCSKKWERLKTKIIHSWKRTRNENTHHCFQSNVFQWSVSDLAALHLVSFADSSLTLLAIQEAFPTCSKRCERIYFKERHNVFLTVTNLIFLPKRNLSQI